MPGLQGEERLEPWGSAAKLPQILHHVYVGGGTDSSSATCANVLQDDFDVDYLLPRCFPWVRFKLKAITSRRLKPLNFARGPKDAVRLTSDPSPLPRGLEIIK